MMLDIDSRHGQVFVMPPPMAGFTPGVEVVPERRQQCNALSRSVRARSLPKLWRRFPSNSYRCEWVVGFADLRISA